MLLKPREEEDLATLYPNFDPSKPIPIVSSLTASNRRDNDWAARLEPIRQQLQTAKQLGTLGLGPIAGKRGRGRPRTKPLPASVTRPPASLRERFPAAVAALPPPPTQGILPRCLRRKLAEYADPSAPAWDEETQQIVPRYDLDETDWAWLRLFNQQRVLPVTLTADWLELALDGLERHWWRLSHRLASWISHQQPTVAGSACAVCGQCESASPANLMVMCEGCDVAVHQECYGILHIPEGPWLCRRCLVAGSGYKQKDLIVRSSLSLNGVRCALCPWPGGALKQTNDPRHAWAHLACVHHLPGEAQLLNPVYREPIDLTAIDPGRWKLTCILCRLRRGAPVQCAERTCHAAMHVHCARQAGCHATWIPPRIYCPRHAPSHSNNNQPRDCEEEVEVVESVKAVKSPTMTPFSKLPLVEIPPESALTRSSARPAFLTAPMAPRLCLDRLLLEELPALPQQDAKYRLPMLQAIARYWALRRRARRGMPLLRHLGAMERGPPIAGEVRTRRHVLGQLKALRSLTAWTARRERLQVAALRTKLELFDCLHRPFQSLLFYCCRTLMKQCDPEGFFTSPVPLAMAPDYYDIVRQPMCMEQIMERIPTYGSLGEFEADLSLIWRNAYLYNAPETIYHQAAQRMETEAMKLIRGIKLQGFTPQSIILEHLPAMKISTGDEEKKQSPAMKISKREEEGKQLPAVSNLSARKAVGKTRSKDSSRQEKAEAEQKKKVPTLESPPKKKKDQVPRHFEHEEVIMAPNPRAKKSWPAKVILLEALSRSGLAAVPVPIRHLLDSKADHLLVKFMREQERDDEWGVVPLRSCHPLPSTAPAYLGKGLWQRVRQQ